MIRPQRFGDAKRVVVKIGSAVLRRSDGFDRVSFAALVRGLAHLHAEGVETVVVCSGAIALGWPHLGLESRPQRMDHLQSAAAVGQGLLMHLWTQELAHYGLTAGQILLTHDDLKNRRRFLAARSTLRTLLAHGIIPVINENDTVAIDEIKMGDNDLLSSQVIGLVEASMLVILSDIKGLYGGDYGQPDAEPLSYVAQIDNMMIDAAGQSFSAVGTGGMRTKLEAVRQANERGAAAVIGPGKEPGFLESIFAGRSGGTWFAPAERFISGRKHWIAYAVPPVGTLHVDLGALQALTTGGKSLLPIGISRIEGVFNTGDVVAIRGPDGVDIARGLVAYDSDTLERARGLRTTEQIPELIHSPEAVHRDDLVLLSREGQPQIEEQKPSD